MHGCGHDGHIAMLLSAAKILKNMEASLNGRVVLMFEEGEEGHRNIEKLLAYMGHSHRKSFLLPGFCDVRPLPIRT